MAEIEVRLGGGDDHSRATLWFAETICRRNDGILATPHFLGRG